MLRSSFLACLLLVIVLVPVPSVAAAQDAPPAQVPQEVRDLVGTYTGAWAMFGIDDKGEVVKRMAWTDILKTEQPQVQGDRAFVAGNDDMTFEGGKIPPTKFQFKEGVFLKKDGSAGDAFIESNGQVRRMIKVGDNVWSYAAPATGGELTMLGFPAGASGQHVLVKVVTKENGVETHRISRLTTVSWKDKEGKEQTLQFVSLQGYHKRQP